MTTLFSPRRFWLLLTGDALNIARDPMLVFAAAMSLLPALALALFRGPMDDAAQAAFGIAGFSRYVVPLALLVPASLIGWVTGFLMLEDRDEGTLIAIDVTPMGKTGFFAYRAALTALLGAAVTLYAWPLIMPALPPLTVLALALVVAANAVAFAVVLPALARNKVEGLALTKLTNLAAVVPLLAAIPSPLRYVAGVFPSYWVGELFGLTDVAPLPLWTGAPLAFAVNGAALWLLFRLLARRAG